MEDDIERRTQQRIIDDAERSSTTSTSFVYRTGHGSYFPKSRHHIISNPRKLQVDFNPRFLTTLSNNTSPRVRQIVASSQHHHNSASTCQSHRVRPYYVPERSRTKSENAAEIMSQADSIALRYPQIRNWAPDYAASTFDDDDDDDHPEDRTNHRANVPGQMDTTPSGSDSMHATVLNTASASSNAIPLDASHQTQSLLDCAVLTKKSRSLEDVFRGARTSNVGTQSHEMEFMSSRIQMMKVQDE